MHARVGPADHLDRRARLRAREDAGRQAHRAHRDVDLALAVLAGEVGQRAGLGPGDARRDCRRRARPAPSRSCRRCRAAGTPPGRRPGAARAPRRCRACAIAGVGMTISSAPRTAAPMSARDQARAARVSTAEILNDDVTAGRQMGRDGRFVPAATSAPRVRPAPDHLPPRTSHCRHPAPLLAS